MKTVIEMAREAELVYWMSNLAQTNGRWWMDAGEPGEELERFAELVRADEREACAELVWPKLKVWSEEEQTAMGLAFNKAQEKHGWYETLMAVGASVLKMKAAAIRARGQA